MLDINDFLLEYKRKIPKMLLIWTLFLTFIISSFLIINGLVTIKNYYKVQGVVNNKYVSIYVLNDDLNKVISNSTLYIDKEKYNYDVITISEDFVVGNSNFYKEVLLSIDLKDKVFIDNNVIDIQFVIKEMTIFKYIVNLIKGE